MNENNLPKIDVNIDLTETIGKAYDDAAKEPLTSSSNAITTVIDFFHNFVLYPMQKYNLYAQDKLQNYANELQRKAQAIPNEHLVAPRVKILGPTVEGLKYNLDEEYIKEMFTNILLSEMDNQKQSKVLPSYIEIVNRLSREDAEFLRLLHNYGMEFCTISTRVSAKDQSGYLDLDKFIIYDYKAENKTYSTLKLEPLIIDNLLMHRLIHLDYDTHYTYETASTQYSTLYNSVKDSYTIAEDSILNHKEGILCLTDFGENFIDICLP